MTSPQRCFNKQFISSNQVNFMHNIKLNEIIAITQKSFETCRKCNIKKLNHYCIETSCKNKSLVCIHCDVQAIQGHHYLHDFTFLLPLFSANVFDNYYQIKQNCQSFGIFILQQIKKISQYLSDLQKIKKVNQKQIKKLKQREQLGKFKQYKDNIEKLIKTGKTLEKVKLQDTFNNVVFMSEQQCKTLQVQMKEELYGLINKLKWLQDPQPKLIEILRSNTQQKKEIFLSRYKKIQFNQIDSIFKTCNQILTQNLQYHDIKVIVSGQLLTKTKFYQAFIYHFKDCHKLCLQNIHMSQIKTPLSFRKLKELQVNLHLQTDSLTSRVQNQNQNLKSFIIKKFRQDDIKFLKYFTSPCKQLKDLYIQFYNKGDLSQSKDLIDYLGGQSNKNLSRFCLKIRTQSQVKRIYGYLTKFYKDSTEVNYSLNQCIINLLQKNVNLTKIVIEGLKNIDRKLLIASLQKMKFLLQYRIYYQNIDLLNEVDNQDNKLLSIKCQIRNRMIYSLAKMSKEKRYSLSILKHIASDFLL